jgi:hypothetical protein
MAGVLTPVVLAAVVVLGHLEQGDWASFKIRGE